MRATDLSEEQREKLYEGFLELNLRPTPPPENKIVVETTGKLEIGPGPPDLSGEVEKILTPEQWEHYQFQREATTANTGDQTEAMMEMMESLLPTVIELLENDP
ncbi:MAG: hypothetical protein EOP83_28490 [Verrucomicrobiaceae bacterium]|nr:MAG: hypothetical protein EOP83_28490 [Verrucomicrobiaceae bacterium]